jgi:hypothetical protein
VRWPRESESPRQAVSGSWFGESGLLTVDESAQARDTINLTARLLTKIWLELHDALPEQGVTQEFVLADAAVRLSLPDADPQAVCEALGFELDWQQELQLALEQRRSRTATLERGLVELAAASSPPRLAEPAGMSGAAGWLAPVPPSSAPTSLLSSSPSVAKTSQTRDQRVT